MADTKALVLRTSIPASAVERRFWATATSGKILGMSYSGSSGVVLSSAYSIFLLDLATNSPMVIPGLDPAGRTDEALYQFPMAPQQYECVEPASTTITPTQEGGKFVESQGSLFKDIRISGTVGFRPNPASTELIPGLGNATGVQLTMPSALQQLFNDERGLSPNEATGFDDIIFLRNIFRAYWDLKQNPDTARRVALVWIYAKESESWVVEPMQFVTTREASKPLSWLYQIQLRTLYPLGFTFRVIDDALGFFGGLSKFLNAVQTLTKAIKDIGKFFNQLSNLVNYIVRLPFKLVNDIIGGALSVMSSLADLKNSLDFSDLPKQTWEKWGSDLREAYYIMTGVSNTSTPTAPPTSSINPSPKDAPANNRGATGQEGRDGEAAKVIRDGLRTYNTLITSSLLWAQSKQVQVKDYSSAYLDEFGEPPLTAGSPLNVANLTVPSSAKQVIIEGGEDLRAIAKRLLGNEALWKLLAILNNLKAPYIAAVRSPGVLAYGDPILIPKTADGIEEQSGVAPTTNTDADLESLDPIMRRYGRDLRLVAVSEDGIADLDVNQRGDFETVDGVDNVHQAVMIKFSTEQGELATHPTFGAKYAIGTKFPTLAKLQDFSLNAQSTLQQDPRVGEITEFGIKIYADQLQLKAKAKLRGSDVQLPVSFTVRR